ncbi:acyl-CoA desaturase [Pseudonocardia sp. MH-G8]|uniref:fatty acid desaturase family protein n=1 Tax=Pseudonocardia sp. MH-G8 TaxID=1854588 RepID=UPI001E2A12DA|nr:acyl-CoA desaturase [Pseudonocardia sp. MH-G8]
MVPPTPATDVPPDRPTSDFGELTRTVRQAGLLQRRTGHYALRIGLTLTVLAATWTVFVLLGDTWWQLVTAAVLAAVWTHVSFIGHDAGHKQIFTGRRANDAVGLVHAGLVGLSYGWWVGKHSRHHANPNHEDDDPDLDIPILAFTAGQSRTKQGVQRWTTKYQAFLFLPLLLLEGASLHWSSVDAAWRGKIKLRGLEKAQLIVHAAAYLGAVFLVLPPGKAVAFIVVHQGLWGFYMGCSFAPNHKGMPVATGAQSWDFLRKQVLTSRNVRGGPWVDFMLGGLNYQIEHHLFPSMPRPNLRRAQPLVEAFCAERGIAYHQCGLLRSYRDVLAHLHTVGAPLRAARQAR